MEFELGTALVQLIAFLILLWFLSKFAWKPLVKMLNDRREYIENQLSSAEREREEAERVLEEHRALVEKARQDAHEWMENARRTSERQAAEILAAAETEARRIKEEALAEIQSEKEKALAELRDQVGELSVMLAGRILAKELDAKSHRELVDRALAEMGDRV
ncbi:ATP synthase F0 subunit B [Kyrpidia spormannii]|uniref:ATP synthase subunit b n=3 Tax=Kyrpidia TaxID=1129704 RepID=A0A2K8NAA9_9BACL|nr:MULTISPECIES: F0F1 ATP synthase subunit B [Kyrpidia]HHY67605.1 F0F1 ATP synthase subunit B [Alicyclobacillus sp.]ADG07845.1 ATP synthase F0, B subunit [Kyrpidia tusciae DSM 2912]ATY86243.1 ATP synthase F0 subunit B [Kyrpidia spormannii]MCL6576537.1 F0F1 ATP synthase subunit B [Kyrpidia sp.]CAB3395682.1 ATP synthase (subunit b, component F0) [Kyrpidia spormannii]